MVPTAAKAAGNTIVQFLSTPRGKKTFFAVLVILIVLSIWMIYLYATELEKYKEDQAAMETLRDFIIADNKSLEDESDTVLFQLAMNMSEELYKLQQKSQKVMADRNFLARVTRSKTGKQFYGILYYKSLDKMTWDNAKTTCEGLRGQLTGLPTMEQQDFLVREIQRERGNLHWIGLHRTAATPPNKWDWVASMKFHHTRFNSNMPTESTYKPGGLNCVALGKDCSGDHHCWQQRRCNEYLNYLCWIFQDPKWI